MIKGNTGNKGSIISEMKLDFSFLNSQFAIEEYTTPLRYDKNCHGGEILLFVREVALARMVGITLSNDFEEFFIELNFRNFLEFPLTV